MIDEFCEEVRREKRAGRTSAALRRVMEFVDMLHRDPATTGVLHDSPALDALCAELAAGIPVAADVPPLPAEGAQIYIATEIYNTGGHTRVLLDFIDAQPGREHVLLLTNLWNRSPDLRRILGDRPVTAHLAPDGDLEEKLAWLIAVLRAWSSRRIFLFHHHEDAVAVAACAEARPEHLYHYHHADHHLSLGCHLAVEGHLDLTTWSWHRCRSRGGLRNVVHLPITVPAQPLRNADDFRHGARDACFVVCTAGNEGKFSQPYDFSFVRILPALMHAHAGTHLHIGPMGEDTLAVLRAGLVTAGVDVSRFRHIPHVPSIAAAMAEEKVSVYLGSWPIGGLRGVCEVLATGTPVIGHRNYMDPFLGCQFMSPPGCPVWHTPEELAGILRSTDAASLAAWSAAARSLWAERHDDALLRGWLAPDRITGAPPPEAMEDSREDALRAYLTRRSGQDSALPALSAALAAAEAKSADLRARLLREREKSDSLRVRLAAQKASATPPSAPAGKRSLMDRIFGKRTPQAASGIAHAAADAKGRAMSASDTVLANDFTALWAAVEDDVIAATRQVGASGWYILGKEVAAFEEALAASWGLPHAVGTANGMDALEIALRAGGLQPGEKVMTTPLSAFASTLAIVRAGGLPVFVDTDAGGLMDLDQAEAALDADSSIRWLLPVHLYGHALDGSRLATLREKRGLQIIEDCAQSIGARTGGKAAGSIGLAAATSFYPTKNLGAFGDGGALLTADADLAARARQWRDYGQSAKYVHSLPGLNSRLDELQAAILRRAILPRLEEFTARRCEIAAQYQSAIRNPCVQVVPYGAHSSSVWHLFPVSVPQGRADFLRHLTAQGIQGGIHYPSIIPDQPAMKDVPHVCAGPLERSRALADAEVSLPVHPFLSDAQVERVIRAVNSWEGPSA